MPRYLLQAGLLSYKGSLSKTARKASILNILNYIDFPASTSELNVRSTLEIAAISSDGTTFIWGL
jgi:hypothetical protein